MTYRTTLQYLSTEQRHSAVRPLDIALAQQLAEMHGVGLDDPSVPEAWAWLTVSVSACAGQGHVGIALQALNVPGFMGSASTIDANTLQQCPWIGGPGDQRPIVTHQGMIYLARLWHVQQQVARLLQQRTNPSATSFLIDDGQLMKHVDALYPNAKLDALQRQACVRAARARFTLLTGGPGTGKTTAVVRILAVLQACVTQPRQTLRINLAAPTGKAAARLAQSIGRAIERLPEGYRNNLPSQVQTLHQLLKIRPHAIQGAYSPDSPLPCDVMVVDEASMVDLDMFARLLKSIPLECRLIVLGDPDQLSSVEAGSVLGDLAASAQQQNSVLCGSRVHLVHSHRFDAQGGIGRLAHAVNEGNLQAFEAIIDQPSEDVVGQRVDPAGPYLARAVLGFSTLGAEAQAKQEHAFADANSLAQGYRAYLAHLAARQGSDDEQWARHLLHLHAGFQVLAAVNEGAAGVVQLNQFIESTLATEGLIKPSGGHPHGWYEGRPVMQTRNDYQLDLMNGDVGITVRLHNEPESPLVVVFEKPGGRLQWVSTARLNEVTTVYAMTVHKSQGSEFGHVVLCLGKDDHRLMGRELLYTAITRAVHRFTVLIDPACALDRLIERTVERHSGLQQALMC